MSTATIRIDPDGTVERLDARTFTELREVATATLATDSLSVELLGRCNEYSLSLTGLCIAVIDDWGATKGLPVNAKAWALYGRSPLVGPVFVGLDSNDDGTRDDLPDEFIDLIASPEFPPSDLRERMAAWVVVHNRLPADERTGFNGGPITYVWPT